MNIFKALSEGNGRISETNITSFINYLLNSANELNNSFFILFIKLIDSQTDNKICDLLGIKQKTIREQIRYFSNNFIVSTEAEYSLQIADGSKQIPDILLRVSSKINEKDITIFIIENKINKSAIKEGQIEKQFEYFINSEESDRSKIYSVLITPDEKAFEQLYISAKNRNSRTVWVKWINHSDDNISIEAIMRQLIKYEHDATIEPIDPNTQYILKSFIDYIATEFSLKENGKLNYSYKGFETIDEAHAVIDETEYYIKRFSNNMIRLFDNESNLLSMEVKPVLRNINEKYKLGIGLNDSTGKAKNTQVLGREIINGLKKINAV